MSNRMPSHFFFLGKALELMLCVHACMWTIADGFFFFFELSPGGEHPTLILLIIINSFDFRKQGKTQVVRLILENQTKANIVA
jgi:hypothetical protein